MAKEQVLPKSLQPDADAEARKMKELRLARRIQFLDRALEVDELAERMPRGSSRGIVENNKRLKSLFKGRPRHYHDPQTSTLQPMGPLHQRQAPLPRWVYDEADEIRTTLPSAARSQRLAKQVKSAVTPGTNNGQTKPVPPAASTTSSVQPPAGFDLNVLQAMTDEQLDGYIMTAPLTSNELQIAMGILSNRGWQPKPGVPPMPDPVVTEPNGQTQTKPSPPNIQDVVNAMLRNIGRKPPIIELEPLSPDQTNTQDATTTPVQNPPQPEVEVEIQPDPGPKPGTTTTSKHERDSQTDSDKRPTKVPRLELPGPRVQKSTTKLVAPDETRFNLTAKRHVRIANKLPPRHCLWSDHYIEAQEIEVADAADQPWRTVSVTRRHDAVEKGLSVPFPCLIYENAYWVPCDGASIEDNGLTVKYVVAGKPHHRLKTIKFNYRGNSEVAKKLNPLVCKGGSLSNSNDTSDVGHSFMLQNQTQHRLEATGSPHFVQGWGQNKRCQSYMVATEHVDKGTLAMEKYTNKLRDTSSPLTAWQVLRCLAKSISVMAYGTEDPDFKVPGWEEIVHLDWRLKNIHVGPQNLADSYHTCGDSQTCYKLGNFADSFLVLPNGKMRDNQRLKELQNPLRPWISRLESPEAQESKSLREKKVALQERIDHPIAARYSYKTNIYLMAHMLRNVCGRFEEAKLSNKEKAQLQEDLIGFYEDDEENSPQELRTVALNLKLSNVRLNRVLDACLRENPSERPELNWLLAQATLGLAEAGNKPEEPDNGPDDGFDKPGKNAKKGSKSVQIDNAEVFYMSEAEAKAELSKLGFSESGHEKRAYENMVKLIRLRKR